MPCIQKLLLPLLFIAALAACDQKPSREEQILANLPLQEAYYETLRSTGKAVLFTGLCLAIGVCTWIFSAIKFQADMGLMLTFMLLWNMFGALWLLPALARFLIKPEKLAGQKGNSLFAH